VTGTKVWLVMVDPDNSDGYVPGVYHTKAEAVEGFLEVFHEYANTPRYAGSGIVEFIRSLYGTIEEVFQFMEDADLSATPEWEDLFRDALLRSQWPYVHQDDGVGITLLESELK